jgi:hypothetical protein
MVAMGLHSYQDKHGQMPPAVVYGPGGKPLYSWRVLILPYLEQKELYDQFNLDESWDSPHNSKLLSKMPHAYALPPRKMAKMNMPPDQTICHVFVGRKAAFEGREGLRLSQDFPDGTCNTILLIEAGKPVPWTKPEDLPFDPDEPLPDLSGPFREIIRLCMADGSRHHISRDLSETTLRAAITRNGHDKLGEDWR